MSTSPETTGAIAASAQSTEIAAAEPHHRQEAIPICTNCGTAVPLKFCGGCGQRREHAVHSLWHFASEATEDLTHADSRLWRTLAALMFKPGFLTREFLQGHRARYLPPLRLYLVLSVLFFLVIGSVDQGARVTKISTNGGSTVLIDVTPRPGETPEQARQRACDPHYEGPAKSIMSPVLRKGCLAMAQDGGHGIREVFLHNAARAMFLFMPVLALVMMAMYWRPRRYYVEHLLFFIHNHAFAFLLLTLLTLVTQILPEGLGDMLSLLVWLYVPYYIFVAMRRVYRQSRKRTFTKLIALSIAYLMGMLLTVALTGLYSLWTA